MKKMIVVPLLCMAALAQAAPFAAGDPAAGRQLFEQNNCNSCHIKVVGGDGSAIFTRTERKATSAEKLAMLIYACSGSAGMELTPQDESNLGAYLNQNYYLFK